MNPDFLPHTRHPLRSAAAWVCAAGLLAAVVGYLAWTVLSDSFPAEQARLHPLLAGRSILHQLTAAAPAGEWNIPLLSIAVWCMWVFGLFTCGTCVLHRLLPNAVFHQGNSTRAFFSFCVGFVLFGWIEAVISAFGMARLPLIPVFAFGGIISIVSSRAIRRSTAEVSAAALWQWRNLCLSGRVLAAIGLAGVVLMLVPALTPPIQSDAVRYHLGAPQEFLKSGSLAYLPLNAYSNMPFLAEMHYMAALGLKADIATQLMHLTLALATATGIYAMGRHFKILQVGDGVQPGTTRAADLVAPMLYLSTPMAAILATWPFTDHAISMLLIASTIAAMDCIKTAPGIRPWLLLGIMLGGLIGTKYTMAPVAVIIFVLALALSPWRALPANTGAARTFLRRAVAAGIFAMLIGGIWFLRNWVLIGNPFYPFASSIFPGGEWGPSNNAFLQARAGAKGFGHHAAALFTLPWNSTFRWINFEAHNPGVAVLGSILAAGAGFIVHLYSRARREAILVFATAACTFATWFFTYQSNRLLLPVIAISFGLFPAFIYAGRRLAGMLLNAAAALYVIIGFGWAVQWSWVATSLSPPPLGYLLGQQDEALYRYQSLTYGRAFDYLNKHVAPGETVLLIGEHRIYGAKFHAIWSDWFDTPALIWILRQHNINTSQQLLEYLRSTGTTWIMINEEELKPQLERDFKPWFRPQEWQIFQDLRTLSGPGIQVIQMPPGATIIHLVASQ